MQLARSHAYNALRSSVRNEHGTQVQKARLNGYGPLIQAGGGVKDRREAGMTQIGQDTGAVHLADDNGKPLCGAGPDALALVTATEWKAGRTAAGQGARMCHDCETVAEHPTMPELTEAEDMGR